MSENGREEVGEKKREGRKERGGERKEGRKKRKPLKYRDFNKILKFWGLLRSPLPRSGPNLACESKPMVCYVMANFTLIGLYCYCDYT